jgi:hypothetical protein
MDHVHWCDIIYGYGKKKVVSNRKKKQTIEKGYTSIEAQLEWMRQNGESESDVDKWEFLLW